jgi:plastocyanin
MRLKTLFVLALCAVFALAITGCAQDNTNTTDDNPAEQEANLPSETGTNPERTAATGGTDGTKVALSTDPSGALKFNTTKLNAEAGALDVVLLNESSTPHDVAVEDKSGKVLGTSEEVTKGHTTLALEDVAAGSYTFYCTLPGHEQAGMKGTLTVR